jgi:hypothetical protein
MWAGTGIDVQVTIGARAHERGGSMAVLMCPCPRRSKLWAEFWWVGREYRWIFFDDNETSETYSEQVTNCPGCGRPLDRKILKTASAFVPQS